MRAAERLVQQLVRTAADLEQVGKGEGACFDDILYPAPSHSSSRPPLDPQGNTLMRSHPSFICVGPPSTFYKGQ